MKNVAIAALFALVSFLPPIARAGQADADRLLCHKGFLQIVSPDAGEVSPEQCKTVADQVIEAWKFDAARMHWSSISEWDKRPLKLRLLSLERMKTEHHGLYGMALGRDQFIVSMAVLDNPAAQGTLAHELGHTQSFRAMGGREEHHPPHYFFEGQANLLGRAYRDQLQVANHHYDGVKARQMAKITADDAKVVYTDPTYGALSHGMKEVDLMESMGIFFVEYLRVNHNGGTPDVLPRIGRVFELVGEGRTFDRAFHEAFGAPLNRTLSEMLGFIRRTEGNPEERLRATIYEQFLGR